MTSEHLIEELKGMISAPISLSQIVVASREYCQQGVARQEVQSALERLREKAQDEDTEDRILEVMDIVSGSCSPQMTVWHV
jgi:hypothetical protein